MSETKREKRGEWWRQVDPRRRRPTSLEKNANGRLWDRVVGREMQTLEDAASQTSDDEVPF